MSRESTLIRMMKNDYSILGLNMEDTYKKTDILLKLYRKVNWSIEDCGEELNEITYESCMGDVETLSYLLNFAPDKELDVFRARAVNYMQSRVLIDLMDKAILKVKVFPESGGIYYSIFDLKYLNHFTYTEEEILETLDLERSTYYRRKKEGTYLLGYILFGFVMPEYVNSEKVAAFCD